MKPLIIALDLDGTVSPNRRFISKKLIHFLSSLKSDNLHLFFLTGRSVSSAYHLLQPFQVPYFLAPSNGTSIVEMPSRRVVFKKHFEREEILKLLQASFEGPFKTGPLLCGSIEMGEKIFYCPSFFHESKHPLLKKRFDVFKEDVESFDSMHQLPQGSFSCLHFMEEEERAFGLADFFLRNFPYRVEVMKDCIFPRSYIVQVQPEGTSKGGALKYFKEQFCPDGYVVACGDDRNDISMLEIADHPMCIEGAPTELSSVAKQVVAKGQLLQSLKEALLPLVSAEKN